MPLVPHGEQPLFWMHLGVNVLPPPLWMLQFAIIGWIRFYVVMLQWMGLLVGLCFWPLGLAHIPHLEWPLLPWSGVRVLLILGRMREGAAPGSLGIPLAVWKVLPGIWHDAVARLLSMVEISGVWPSEWVEAYVAMIPKSSGGSRPRDQRPITVLDLLYRIWSKGIYSIGLGVHIANLLSGASSNGLPQ